MRYQDVALSYLPSLLLPCQHCGHRMVVAPQAVTHDDARPRIDRQASLPIVRHDREQFLHPAVALRRHDAEFGQMRPPFCRNACHD